MSVESKIRELLESRKQLAETGDTTNPKQGSSESSPSTGPMGAEIGRAHV